MFQKYWVEFLNFDALGDKSFIWVQDSLGASGNSTFFRYLRFGQTNLTVRKLPFDQPDRLRMFICKIAEETDIDLFVFDFIKTFDENTSLNDLFEVIEEIKNSYVVDIMYGNFNRAFLKPSIILIFTTKTADAKIRRFFRELFFIFLFFLLLKKLNNFLFGFIFYSTLRQ